MTGLTRAHDALEKRIEARGDKRSALSLFQFVGLVRASMSRRVMRGVSMVMDGKDVRHRARLGSARGHGLGGSSHDADVLLASL
jgi:hypothetical protein